MELLTWEALARHLDDLNPSALLMGGTRGIRIGFVPDTKVMYLRLPLEPGADIPPSAYAEIATQVINDDTGLVMEITTGNRRHFREFHTLATMITEAFEVQGSSAPLAFASAAKRWRELTARRELLTEEQQLGLHGELVFLRALISSYGADSVAMWTGRDMTIPERHDFRLQEIDVEVKSTRMHRRSHIIHGMGQLQPRPGRRLYVVSLRFESAGAAPGYSLADEVSIVRKAMWGSEASRGELEMRLEAAGYRDADAPHYSDRLSMAAPPAVIPVDTDCPRIVRELLVPGLPPEALGRLDAVSYRVDFDGLGGEEGSELFREVFGPLRVGVP